MRYRVREHFLKHVSRIELEHLATALEATLDVEGTPFSPRFHELSVALR